MKVMLFDTSNLMMRSLYANKPSPTENKFDLVKLTFIGSMIKEIKSHQPDKVIMVEDSESWRKEIYPAYKATREAKRAADAINFTAFYSEMNKFFEKLSICCKNIQFLKVPKAEADDCIAVIVKNKPDWNIINVSSDKDFYQLFKYSNYSQWDGVNKKFIEVLDPEQALQVKIITGDKGDNIPALKYRVGVATAIKILNEDLDAWLKKEQLDERYKQNTQLISFDAIPNEIELSIINTVNDFKVEAFDNRKYFNFVSNSGLAELVERFTEYSETLKKLN